MKIKLVICFAVDLFADWNSVVGCHLQLQWLLIKLSREETFF